ncbi:transposase [Haloglycomyces albus]|uniref:transposase n=1 Tax=Haloglycomyces albus TaxID=526067 RepID=UPI0004AEE219|nr:transposase [Haloglycomyces albus]
MGPRRKEHLLYRRRKNNQKLQYQALKALPWNTTPIGHTTSDNQHGRKETRSVKVTCVDETIKALRLPGANLAIQLHRRRTAGRTKETRETVSNLPAHLAIPEHINHYMRRHWTIENRSHHVRDRTFREDASTVSTGNAPRAMAGLRNLAIGALRLNGAINIAKACRHNAKNPERALPALGITP